MAKTFPKERIQEHIEEALNAINLSKEFVGNMTQSQFVEDTKTVYAVIRCINIISRKAARLDRIDGTGIITTLIPLEKIARMEKMTNVLYGQISPDIVWKTVKKDLPEVGLTFEKTKDEINNGRIQRFGIYN